MILDPTSPKKGIVELRTIDPTKIRKVKMVKKKPVQDKNSEAVTLYQNAEEFYVYNEKSNQAIL